MINDSSKADKTYSVEQFIDMRSSDSTTYYNYSIMEYLNGFEYALTNILYDYQDEIEEQSVILKLNNLEFSKYKYRPWLLAYDIYGSEQASFIILALNGILSDREFDFQRVRIIHPDVITSLLGRIYSANTTYINNNRSDLAYIEKKDTVGNSVW